MAKVKRIYDSTLNENWTSSSLKVIYSPITLYEKAICTEEDSIEVIRRYWNNETIALQEQVMAFYLNNANKLIGYRLISTGTMTACLVDVKLVVSLALNCMATYVILAHNHPSGNLKPSKQDIQITEKVKKALELIDIKLLDHIILTSKSHLSLFSDGYC